MVQVKLKDGSIREVAQGTTLGELAEQLSRSLAKKVLVGKVDGQVKDLASKLNQDAAVELLTFEQDAGRDALRHSASHLLAQAVKRLYGDKKVKIAIGPAIANGFYYDFDVEEPFSTEDLARIQKEMEKIVKEDLPISRKEASREEAVALFAARGEDYKVELIQDLPADAVISMYEQGEFVDLCAGPHVSSTGKLKAIQLQSVAGAYWRGDEKRKMLQRIYGTVFEKKADLDAYLLMLEEAAKRDHRKLGKELDLFSMQEEGPGFPFFHPNGMVVRNELKRFGVKCTGNMATRKFGRRLF